MPLAILAILRPLILWLSQAAITGGVFAIIETTFDKILEAIREHYGLTENDARIVLANWIIDALALIGVGTAVIYKKLPLKIADKLGFTANGAVKRNLSATGQSKVNAKNKTDKDGKGLGAILWKKIKSVSKVNWLIVFLILQGVGDWFIFGRSVLQKTLRDITGNSDLELPGGKDAPPGFSENEWNDYTSSLELAGIVGLKNESARQSQPYTKEGLAQLVAFLYGREAAAGKSTTPIALQKAAAPFLIMKGATTPLTSSTQAKTAPPASAGVQTRVFTGIVSQGILGSGLSFTPRPDDLIQNIFELQDAINNNVAPFLAALPSKIVYEIKVVPSVIVNGLKLTGTSQRIITDYAKDGTPKHKTVVNKFAVADLFILTDKGTRTRIARLVLGPTDALAFQPTTDALAELANALPKTVVSDNTDDISVVVSNTPTLSQHPQANAPAAFTPTTNIDTTSSSEADNAPKSEPVTIGNIRVPARVVVSADALRIRVMPSPTAQLAGAGRLFKGQSFLAETIVDGETVDGIDWWWETPQKQYLWLGGTDWKNTTYDPNRTTPPFTFSQATSQSPASAQTAQEAATTAAAAAPSVPILAQNARTLFEFYSAYGRALPPLLERAGLYDALGLGKANFYTGTAEQNTKLLLALKVKGL